MRLKTEEIKLIKQVIGTFDPDAEVYLFGSRVHDDKKGGDIDLLILSEKLTSRDVSKIRIELEDHLGMRRIDILIRKNLESPFVRMAHDEGVLL